MSAEDSRFVVFLDGFPRFWGGSRNEASDAIAQAADSSCLSRPRFALRQSMVTSTAPAWRGTPSRFSSMTTGGLGAQNAAGAGKWSPNLIDGGLGRERTPRSCRHHLTGPAPRGGTDRGARTGRYGGTGEARRSTVITSPSERYKAWWRAAGRSLLSVTRWSEATEGVSWFRRLVADTPLSIDKQCRPLAALTLSQATVASDDQRSIRLLKRRYGRSRDEVAVAGVLSAGALVRDPGRSKPRRWRAMRARSDNLTGDSKEKG